MAARSKQIVQRVLSGFPNLFQNSFGYRHITHLVKHNGNHRVFRLLLEHHFCSVSNKVPDDLKRYPKHLDHKLSEHHNDHNARISNALKTIVDFENNIEELLKHENEDDYLHKRREFDRALQCFGLKTNTLLTQLEIELDDKLHKLHEEKKTYGMGTVAAIVVILVCGAIVNRKRKTSMRTNAPAPSASA